MRNNFFPLANIGSRLAMPLFLIGFIFSAQGASNFFMDLGILLFAFTVVFHIITLPVEFNASSRAIARWKAGILLPATGQHARYWAAALT